MTIGSQLSASHVTLAADLAAAVGDLPAIATVEWCDDAAAMIRMLRPGSIACVAIAQVNEGGAIAHIEAVGAAGHDAQGRAVSGESLLPLHAAHLDWWIGDGDRTGAPRAAVLRELRDAERFAGSESARRWSRQGVADWLVGIAPIPGNVPERRLIVQLGIGPTARRFEAPEAMVLAAILGPLGSRALLAFGPDVTNPMARLTAREREVLDHLTLGKSVKEIAADLARSPHTVHDHVKSLHRKLNATSRGELIARALGHIAACGASETVRAFRVQSRAAEPAAAPNIVFRPSLASA